MTQDIIKDPPTSWEAQAFVYNKEIDKNQFFLDCNEFLLDNNNLLTANCCLLDFKLLQLYKPDLELKSQILKDINWFPSFTFTFNSINIYDDKTANILNYDLDINKRQAITYELQDCEFNKIDIRLMPGRRVIASFTEITYKSINSYKEDYQDYNNKLFNYN